MPPGDLVYVEGMEGYEQRIRALAALIVDLRPFWPRVRSAWIGWVSETFETEGAFLGLPWDALSEPYASWKARYFPGKPILSLAGDLRRHATTPAQAVGPGFLELIVDPFDHRAVTYQNSSGGQTTIAERTIEPGWFQHGTSRMPRRPLAATGPEMLTPGMHDELTALGEAYADEMARSLRLI